MFLIYIVAGVCICGLFLETEAAARSSNLRQYIENTEIYEKQAVGCNMSFYVDVLDVFNGEYWFGFVTADELVYVIQGSFSSSYWRGKPYASASSWGSSSFCRECTFLYWPKTLTDPMPIATFAFHLPKITEELNGLRLGALATERQLFFLFSFNVTECPKRQNGFWIRNITEEKCGCGCYGTVACPDGYYNLNTNLTVNCLSNATWNLTTDFSEQCKTECKPFQNGTSISFESPCLENCQGRYTCPEGYVSVRDPPIAICDKNLEWNLVDSCENITTFRSGGGGGRNAVSLHDVFPTLFVTILKSWYLNG